MPTNAEVDQVNQLKFTPLEFETSQEIAKMGFVDCVKIYSVGV